MADLIVAAEPQSFEKRNGQSSLAGLLFDLSRPKIPFAPGTGRSARIPGASWPRAVPAQGEDRGGAM